MREFSLWRLFGDNKLITSHLLVALKDEQKVAGKTLRKDSLGDNESRHILLFPTHASPR